MRHKEQGRGQATRARWRVGDFDGAGFALGQRRETLDEHRLLRAAEHDAVIRQNDHAGRPYADADFDHRADFAARRRVAGNLPMLLFGGASGVRLSDTKNVSEFWGKDSQAFMTDAIAWLLGQ